jgi:hypothetical protein
MFIVLTSTCTHGPVTELYPSRETPLPHHVDTTDPQEGHQLRDDTVTRRETYADTPRVGSEYKTDEHLRVNKDQQNCRTVRKGAPQGGEGQYPPPALQTTSNQ